MMWHEDVDMLTRGRRSLLLIRITMMMMWPEDVDMITLSGDDL